MLRAARLVALAGLFFCLSARLAAAQEPAAAAGRPPEDEELIARGVELRTQRRDAEALEAFARALAIRSSARAVAQMALAHQALTHWKEAETGLTEALSSSADGWVVRNRMVLEESLAEVRAHLAWLEVESNAQDAELYVAGELCCRLPQAQPLRIVAGDVLVEVRAPAFPPLQRTLHAEPASHVHAVFTFDARPRSPRPVPTNDAVAPAPAPISPLPSPSRRLAWYALGAAGGFVLLGTGATITREWEAHIYNDDGQCAPSNGQPRYVRCNTNRELALTAQTVAIVAFGLAGAAAAVGGTLLLTSEGGQPRVGGAPLGCALWAVGFACRASF
jgi:hypothetical protein